MGNMNKYSMAKILANLRRRLILALVGNCSVMVNVDIYGKYHMKGRCLLMHNSIAQDPTGSMFRDKP